MSQLFTEKPNEMSNPFHRKILLANTSIFLQGCTIIISCRHTTCTPPGKMCSSKKHIIIQSCSAASHRHQSHSTRMTSVEITVLTQSATDSRKPSALQFADKGWSIGLFTFKLLDPTFSFMHIPPNILIIHIKQLINNRLLCPTYFWSNASKKRHINTIFGTSF